MNCVMTSQRIDTTTIDLKLISYLSIELPDFAPTLDGLLDGSMHGPRKLAQIVKLCRAIPDARGGEYNCSTVRTIFK